MSAETMKIMGRPKVWWGGSLEAESNKQSKYHGGMKNFIICCVMKHAGATCNVEKTVSRERRTGLTLHLFEICCKK